MNANIRAKPKILNSNTFMKGSKKEKRKKNSLPDSPEVWLTQNY